MPKGILGMTLDSVLRDAVDRGASDIHLKLGRPPLFRVNGSICASASEALAEVAPAVVCVWLSAISFVLGSAGTLSSVL